MEGAEHDLTSASAALEEGETLSNVVGNKGVGRNPGHTPPAMQFAQPPGDAPALPGGHPAQAEPEAASDSGGAHTSGTQSAAEESGAFDGGCVLLLHARAGPATHSACPDAVLEKPAPQGKHASGDVAPRVPSAVPGGHRLHRTAPGALE